jgi:hypothetical protein
MRISSASVNEEELLMSRNVGAPDRITRALAGGGFAMAELAGFLGGIEQYFHFFAIIVAVWLVGTSASGNCPAYSVMGISTCPHFLDEEE